MNFAEMFRKFFVNYAQGRLSVRDPAFNVLPLKHADPQVWELARCAVEFRYEEKWHSREAFMNLMNMRMQPGTIRALTTEEERELLASHAPA